MGTQITISLDDDQTVSPIRMAATEATTTERLLLRLLDRAIYEAEIRTLT